MPFDDALLADCSQWETNWIAGAAGGWLTNSTSGAVAWFKSTPTPHLALDFIGTTLATGVGLPVLKSGFATVNGVSGFYCHEAPRPYALWNQLPSQHQVASPNTYLANAADLVPMLVFDAWMGNTDRHGANLVIHELAPGRWKFFVIDHGHCFWSGTWLNGGYTHTGPNLLARSFHRADCPGMTKALDELVVAGAAVDSVTTAIASTADAFLDAVVDLIPDTYIDGPRRQIMKDVLKQRRDGIGMLAQSWWQP